ADHHHRMFLQIVPLARDVADHFETVGEANLGDLAQRRIRLLRRRRVDARAYAAFLRRSLQRRNLVPVARRDPRLPDQLVDGRHPSRLPLARLRAPFQNANAKRAVPRFPRGRALVRQRMTTTRERVAVLNAGLTKAVSGSVSAPLVGRGSQPNGGTDRLPNSARVLDS